MGVIYLVVVVAGYSLITGESPLASGQMEHDEHNNDESSNEETEGHDDHGTENNQKEDESMNHEHDRAVESEIKTNITYENEEFFIALEDNTGAAPELAVEHEREMHFIVISNDLEEFYHLHPEEEKEGTFRASQELNGTYQAFVDIVPKNKAYEVVPNPMQIGSVETPKASLNAEDDWTKEIDGKTVTLEEVEGIAGEEVPLVFDTHGDQPESHLGALGHVVIVDEGVEEYIHVHPDSEDTTTFNAHFTDPGIYKVWAEFKFDDQIHVYPFVLEVKE